MRKDPLLEVKRNLRPGQRLPREYERDAEDWREQQRDELAEAARQAEFEENEVHRVERYDAVTESYEDQQLREHRQQVERLRRRS